MDVDRGLCINLSSMVKSGLFFPLDGTRFTYPPVSGSSPERVGPERHGLPGDERDLSP